MERKRHPLLMILLIVLLLFLFVGIVLTVLDWRGGKGKKKVTSDGDIVYLDNISGKMDQHTLLLSASQSNNGLVSIDEDYYVSNNWSVYYDGVVEYYECYNLSGRTNVVTWELTDKQFDELVELLQGDFFKYDEDYESACDGDTWHYAYYNLEGEKLHSYNGYNYSVPVLLEISEILDSDMREQAVIEPVEKGDSHNVMLDVMLDNTIEDENADELVSSHWKLYYDGWVELQEIYQIGGKQSIVTWELDDYTYGRVVRELKYYSDKTTNEEPVEGEDYWFMTYYDESGNVRYDQAATSTRNNVFGSIYYELQVPDGGFSYIEEPDAKAGCITEYRVGDYSITINSINPGHADNPAEFFTYFYWNDSENSTTTIHMNYSFVEKNLQDSYILEKLSTTSINGKKYYYNVLGFDNGPAFLYLYCENDTDSYMEITLETTGRYDEDWKWVDETDADIEALLQDEILQEAIQYEIIKE